MKRYRSLIALELSLLFYLGCISFRIDNPAPSENYLESVQLCKKIDESGELFKPLEIQSEFSSKDELIICLVRLKRIETKILLRWKWYSPEKEMVRDTGDVVINPDQKNLEAVTAYDRLKLSPVDNVQGLWTVAVFMNNKFIEKKTFQVRKEFASF